MIDLASDDWLYPVTRTGKRGRPANTGKRDFHLLYAMAEKLAANPALSQAEAARQVADPRDHSAWDRLPRKLRAYPHLLESARSRHENQVQRYLKALRRHELEASLIGFRHKANAIGYVRIFAMVSADIDADPRVVAAEKRFWNAVRPGIVQEMLDRYAEMERLMGLTRHHDEMSRLCGWR